MELNIKSGNKSQEAYVTDKSKYKSLKPHYDKKKIINKIKRKGIWQTGENIYNTNDRKGLISLIYNKLLQISEKDINHSIGKKEGQMTGKAVHRERMEMAHEHMERCSMSLRVKDM